MIIIRMKEPESGLIQKLQIESVHNFTCPGWVVLIPGRKNVLLFWKEDKWHVIPENISYSFAEKIGNKLKSLKMSSYKFRDSSLFATPGTLSIINS